MKPTERQEPRANEPRPSWQREVTQKLDHLHKELTKGLRHVTRTLGRELHEITCALGALQRTETHMAATIQQILDAATEEGTQIDSVLAILQSLKDTTDPAQRDALLTQLLANKQKLVDAITANTPEAPPAA